MKGVAARVVKGLNHGSIVLACDNSGARKLRIISFKGAKTRKDRKPRGGVGDYIMASVREGKPEMRKQVVAAIIVRQRKSYRRADGSRVMFEDNAAAILKDELGNPKGTVIKGPIAKEAADRWPMLAKIARMVI
ncbi:MAG: 50S ribosomal protein L14 [Candidatus Woesearchaeota archaeon]|jgi:large subunit ribosomal protein L14|nr:50S ribosomal protein L14 [Candidatus Woesearchaeota archaeon]MDP7181767.1 50S ribosomal protein L14 [Candidatus Woesearchaeota archaeon]MDP7198856.1 50S ribosomal protein L14 [Candidatus Woesearchaeota archaeon]MDP7467144.1 50S ribosomal protein L14 [Candidatus Woesearchaeota archaeon]MDP7647521.1 50S ribosomal protein L14 [Candidatus Woesearchaeota archaeon]|tara:strand:- start:37 stop:438 length:402 start_codon:yes stop_codon:yes gene_type:complete